MTTEFRRPKRPTADPLAPSLGGRLKWFLHLFGVLFCLNIFTVHYIASDVFETSVMARARAEAGVAEGPTPEELASVNRKGFALLMLNTPVLINLGFAARSTPPERGIGYYCLLVAGSSYAPAFLCVLLFFLIHSPAKWGNLPGVDWRD